MHCHFKSYYKGAFFVNENILTIYLDAFDRNNLKSTFDEFKNMTEDEQNKKKLFAKKQIKKFTQFAHFKSLENIIDLNG